MNESIEFDFNGRKIPLRYRKPGWERFARPNQCDEINGEIEFGNAAYEEMVNAICDGSRTFLTLEHGGNLFEFMLMEFEPIESRKVWRVRLRCFGVNPSRATLATSSGGAG